MRIRSSLALAAILLAAAPLDAQSARRVLPRPRFGIVGGVNLASMTDTENTRRVTGAYVGAQAVLPRNSFFSTQIELTWSQKGVRAAGTDVQSGEPVDVSLRSDYVEVPILMRVDSPLAIGVEPYGVIPFVVAGPSLGVSVRCTIDGTPTTGASSGVPVSYDCDDQFGVKTFDFGAMLGVGLDALVGTRTVSVGARYTIGLQDVFEGTAGRNRAIVLVAGLSF